MDETLLREAIRLMLESVSRYCHFYKASDGNWYMDLANEEYGEYEDATTYGPFGSEGGAIAYLNKFSNPGGWSTDESGERKPPTVSPNGSPVQRASTQSFFSSTSMRGGPYGVDTMRAASPPKVDPEVKKRQHLQSIAERKRPYLVGKWEKLRGQHHSYRQGDCWHAEDPVVGRVFLTVTSSTTYKKVKNSRLREPGGTRYTWACYLGTSPYASYSSDGGYHVFGEVAIGEGSREIEKRDKFRRRMVKAFGIDPYDYYKSQPLDPPKPAPETTPTPEAPKPEPASPSGPAYKVYGKMKGAPAHTRVKGKAYLAPGDTKFKSGQRVKVEPRDGKLSVKDQNSDHTQTWEPES